MSTIIQVKLTKDDLCEAVRHFIYAIYQVKEVWEIEEFDDENLDTIIFKVKK